MNITYLPPLTSLQLSCRLHKPLSIFWAISRKRSDTCLLVKKESSSRPLRSHVSGLNSVLGLLVLCGLVTGAGEAGTASTTGVGVLGEALVLVGLVTLCTGLVGWEAV